VGRAWRDEAEGKIGRSSMAQVFAYVSTATFFYATLTVVQKIALTAIVDQVDNSN
jgi:hypothetical protein